MTTAPSTTALAAIRQEIDTLDAQIHQHLMERSAIIERLIATKRTAESGTAFRPDREASMMEGLVSRHQGVLPLTTVEHIWREIISTFTHLQANYNVHVSSQAPELRDAARFYFGFTPKIVTSDSASEVIAKVTASAGDLGVIPCDTKEYWWHALAEKNNHARIMAVLPFLRTANHPVSMPCVVIARHADLFPPLPEQVERLTVRNLPLDTARLLLKDRLLQHHQATNDDVHLLINHRSQDNVIQTLIEKGAKILSQEKGGSFATPLVIDPERHTV